MPFDETGGKGKAASSFADRENLGDVQQEVLKFFFTSSTTSSKKIKITLLSKYHLDEHAIQTHRAAILTLVSGAHQDSCGRVLVVCQLEVNAKECGRRFNQSINSSVAQSKGVKREKDRRGRSHAGPRRRHL